MAVLSPRMQSTTSPMTESMILSLLDQWWYSQSILNHSIALYVLSAESETVVRSSESYSASATIFVAEECSTSQSIGDYQSIDQERTENETGSDSVEQSVSTTPDRFDERADALASGEDLRRTDTGGQELQESHGKQVCTNYSVTRIPGDGRCLFRAVAHGSSLRCGNGALDESQQRDLADDLRNKVADELVKRRIETEWFIEGDFDVYVNRIRQPHVWGGEPELLMLSHVLKMPITVYMTDRNTKGGLISICEYGQEYGTDNPVQVLYHGFGGHYEAVQIFSDAIAPSRL